MVKVGNGALSRLSFGKKTQGPLEKYDFQDFLTTVLDRQKAKDQNIGDQYRFEQLFENDIEVSYVSSPCRVTLMDLIKYLCWSYVSINIIQKQF